VLCASERADAVTAEVCARKTGDPDKIGAAIKNTNELVIAYDKAYATACARGGKTERISNLAAEVDELCDTLRAARDII
jgi:hypothetical protein